MFRHKTELFVYHWLHAHKMFVATCFPLFVGALKKKQINEQEENKTHRKQWWERGHREPLLWRTAWVHTDPWLWCSRGQPVMEVLQNMYVICRHARKVIYPGRRLPACYINWTTLADRSALGSFLYITVNKVIANVIYHSEQSYSQCWVCCDRPTDRHNWQSDPYALPFLQKWHRKNPWLPVWCVEWTPRQPRRWEQSQHKSWGMCAVLWRHLTRLPVHQPGYPGLSTWQLPVMQSSAKFQSPSHSIKFLCLCDKVCHNQEKRFLLYLLGQIVTWQYTPNPLN